MWQLIKDNLRIIAKNPLWIPIILIYSLTYPISVINRWIKGK